MNEDEKTLKDPLKLAGCFFVNAIVLGIITGCGLQQQAPSAISSESLSAGIQIEIGPQVNGQYVPPQIFLGAPTTTSQSICRRGLPSDKAYGLDPEEIIDDSDTSSTESDNTTETESDNTTETTNDSDQQVDRNQFGTTTVGDNWFRAGLQFANSTDYFFVITEVTFEISANWGTERLSSSPITIDSGYCGGMDGFLYIVPPKVRLPYQPNRRNDLNNLTLFVAGVPIPTSPIQDPQSQGEGGGLAADANQAGGTTQGRQNGGSTDNEIFELDNLPVYRVQVRVFGHFINKQRDFIANFLHARARTSPVVFSTAFTF